MDAAMADRILHAPAPGLDGASFKEAFCRSLSEIRSRIKDTGPELIFLTGGVSKLPAIGKWCQEAFPQAVVITTPQPEFSVARGLAHCGRIDEDIRAFRKEVDDLIETSTVESIVAGHMGDLYRRIADALVDPIMEQPVMNVFDRWRSGQISRLSEIDEELAAEIELFLRGEDAQKILVETISSWLSPVAYELEEYTMVRRQRRCADCRRTGRNHRRSDSVPECASHRTGAYREPYDGHQSPQAAAQAGDPVILREPSEETVS